MTTSSFVERMVIAIREETLVPEWVTFVGCNPEDIERIMQVQSVTFLPALFRELLAIMGHSGIEMVLGGQATCSDLEIIKAEMIHDNPNLPQDVFAFYMHDGFAFYYFHTLSIEENPPVFGSSGTRVEKLADSLEQFLLDRLDDIRKLHKYK